MSAHIPYNLEVVAIDEIGRPAELSVRAEQVAGAAAVWDRFGFLQPIIVDENRNIVAGHMSFWAALKRGERHVPIVYLPKPEADFLVKGR